MCDAWNATLVYQHPSLSQTLPVALGLTTPWSIHDPDTNLNPDPDPDANLNPDPEPNINPDPEPNLTRDPEPNLTRDPEPNLTRDPEPSPSSLPTPWSGIVNASLSLTHHHSPSNKPNYSCSVHEALVY